MDEPTKRLLKKIQENKKSLNIARLPDKTKEEFLAFAKEEFCDDYGMCFKSVWDNFKMWQIFFQNMDMKLDNILERISQLEQTEKKPETDKIKMVDGRTVERGYK